MSASRIPPIQCLLSFEALARLRSVTAAADELHVTPSAISHRIRQLESRVGCTLFTRDFALTDVGQNYLGKVRPAIRALEPPSSAALPGKAVRLKIAAPPTFSRQILLPRLALFRHAYPDIELTLTVSIPLFNVLVDTADIEIRFGDGHYTDVQKVCVLSDEIFPVCSPEYFHECGPFDGFHDAQALARAQLIRCPLEPWKTWFDACGLDWPEPVAGAQFNDVGLSLDAAVAGYGVALARGKLAVPWLDSGRLMRLSSRAVASPHHHFLCWRSGTLERWECSAFVDWLQSVMP